MTRLKQVNARELISALKKAGFIEAGQKGSHHYQYILEILGVDYSRKF